MEEDAKPNSQSAPGSSDLPNETAPKDAEEPAVSTSQTELQSSSATEAEGVAVDLSHSKEPIKEEDMGPASGNKEADALANSTEKDNIAGIDFAFCFFFKKKLVFIIKVINLSNGRKILQLSSLHQL